MTEFELVHLPSGALAIKSTPNPSWLPLSIDFEQGPLHQRHQRLKGKNELIVKAIGYQANKTLHILDATAGLGREAFLLASLGYTVTLLERHPLIYELLKDAIERAAKNPHLKSIMDRMHLIHTSSIDYLKTNMMNDIEVIYCDPMFAPRKKSASVKKEMQILQGLIGFDEDAKELIECALQSKVKRIVVKCPRTEQPYFPPHFSYVARSHRFDVYQK